MAETVTLRATTRYKDTRLYSSDEGNIFGLFVYPSEFITAYDDAIIHEVTRADVGMLDKIAVQYYGPGQEAVWWVIAIANGILDPEIDMFVGQRLVVPPRSALLAFVSRGARA